MSSPSVKSTNTKTSKASKSSKLKKTSKISEYYSPLDFYPTNLKHTFMPKPDFEGYRKEAKKQYEGDGSSPSLLDLNLHQMSDNANIFMTKIRERSLAKIAANDERLQLLDPRVTWDASIDRFEVFRNNVEGHYGQSGSGYLFDPDFQAAYLERGQDLQFT
jgi:hypothetical protein